VVKPVLSVGAGSIVAVPGPLAFAIGELDHRIAVSDRLVLTLPLLSGWPPRLGDDFSAYNPGASGDRHVDLRVLHARPIRLHGLGADGESIFAHVAE